MALQGTPVVRYPIDEAASGTAPTSVLDISGNAYHLTTLNYGSSTLAYTEVSGQRGLASSDRTGNHRASRAINNTADAVRTAFAGAQKATLEVVVNVTSGYSSGGRVAVITDRVGGTGKFGLRQNGDNDNWAFVFNESSFILGTNAVTGLVFGTRHVLQIVLDTTQATQNDRVRICVNGGSFIQVSNTITLNATLSLPSDLDLILFNRESSGTWARSFEGTLFYAAFYADALTLGQCQNNHTELATSDDPTGGADTTAPLITGPSGAAGASTSAKSIVENTTAVHTFTADESVTWSLNGGADAALFTINSSTGALAFSSAPNYESPADADTNNTYVVVVRATDAATNTADQTVTVTVTDADEVSPSLSSAAGASAAPLLCTGSVTTNEGTGSLWAVVTASATAPSAAQVKAGQDHTGSAALRVVTAQAVGGTSISIGSGSVTAGTRYWHMVQDDAAANTSAVVSSASFVVAASYSITTDALEDETGAVLASTALTRAYAIRISDHTLVANWAAPTTNGSGQLVLTDAALTAAPHLIATVSNTNADAGAKVYTPA